MNTTNNISVKPERSFMSRFFHWLFSWRTLRRALLTLVALITLAALLLAEENWRGKRAWEQFKREWEAKGEHFDLASFLPKPVPDEQNFAGTPFLASTFQHAEGSNEVQPVPQVSVYGNANSPPSFGGFEKGNLTDLRKWQQFYRSNTNFPSTPQPQDPARDVLFALGRFDPVLKEVREASSRPHIVLPAHTVENISGLLSCLGDLKALSLILRLRANANLGAGQGEDALQDLKLSFRLAEIPRADPLLVSQLVRIAILHISVSAVWEGLARHQWSEPQLVELQRLLSSVDALADYSRTIRCERAFANQFFDEMRRGEVRGRAAEEVAGKGGSRFLRLGPGGWLYQNQLCANRILQRITLNVVDTNQHRVFPDRLPAWETLPELRRTTPCNMLVRLYLPAMWKVAAKSARMQVVLDEATLACALERFRIANGQYPPQLQALVPRFIEKIPPDVMTGEPLKYRRGAEGQYVLYSVAWDQKDDGGIPIRVGSGRSVSGERGDWIWTCTGN